MCCPRRRLSPQASLSEADRVELLSRELASARPLASGHVAYSERTAGELAVLHAAADAHERFGAAAVPNYIISNCGSFSDLLEVALLLKEAGLLRPTAPAPAAALRANIIPLFETIDDLRRGAGIMDEVRGTGEEHALVRSLAAPSSPPAGLPPPALSELARRSSRRSVCRGIPGSAP